MVLIVGIETFLIHMNQMVLVKLLVVIVLVAVVVWVVVVWVVVVWVVVMEVEMSVLFEVDVMDRAAYSEMHVQVVDCV